MVVDVNSNFNLLTFPLELEAAVREKNIAVNECEHLKRRTEALMVDCEQEKKEKFETKVSQL